MTTASRRGVEFYLGDVFSRQSSLTFSSGNLRKNARPQLKIVLILSILTFARFLLIVKLVPCP
jgi:hypothetical protein